MQQTVGSRIKELAIAKALKEGRPEPTALEIAESIGVTYETLRKWTTSATAPNRRRALKIAELLGVPMGAFMLGAEEDAEADIQIQAYSAEALELAAIYDRCSPRDRKLIRAVVLASESPPEPPDDLTASDGAPDGAPKPAPDRAR